MLYFGGRSCTKMYRPAQRSSPLTMERAGCCCGGRGGGDRGGGVSGEGGGGGGGGGEGGGSEVWVESSPTGVSTTPTSSSEFIGYRIKKNHKAPETVTRKAQKMGRRIQ